jgi:hypothetical protein
MKARLLRNAKAQEGEAPAEKPDDILAEFKRVAGDFETLIARTNLTNAVSTFDGAIHTIALARRDVLRLRQVAYQELAKTGTVTQAVATRSEVRFGATVSVVEIQRRAAELSKQLREFDTRVQEANWRIDLKEV